MPTPFAGRGNLTLLLLTRLAGGIYEAMITTAAGLSVAIPVLICFHWISGKIDRLVMDIDRMTVNFVEEFVEGTLGGAAAGAAGEAGEQEKGEVSPSVVGVAAT